MSKQIHLYQTIEPDGITASTKLSQYFFSGKGRHHTIISSIHSTYTIFSSCSQL